MNKRERDMLDEIRRAGDKGLHRDRVNTPIRALAAKGRVRIACARNSVILFEIKRYAPSCCEANRKHGFVITKKYHVDCIDHKAYGEQWVARIVDKDGVIHECETKRCPACGMYLLGLDMVEV